MDGYETAIDRAFARHDNRTAGELSAALPPRFTSCGKQVFDRAQHFADAASPDAAGAIVSAMNGVGNNHNWASNL